MSKKVLGLDIGITSVGYGVIDIDDNSIVDYGVRLFKEGTAAENEKRRTKRGSRRLKSRKVTRRKDMLDLLKKENVISNDFVTLSNPYDIRIKGLENKLTGEELATALIHILNHRGSSLDVVEEDDTKNVELGATKEVLKENDRLIKEGLYICQIQNNRLQKNDKARGHFNNFRTKDYVNEVYKILSNQGLSDEINEKIIALIQRRRHFSDGPGSFISQTPYGVIYDENGEILIGMIDKMRGKCSVFPEEPRAAKMTYSADLFNLLNDLNNLVYNGDEKISREQKENIIKIIDEKGNITPNQLAKLLGVSLEKIKGFRVNKKEEPLLTEFKGYKILMKIFKENEQEELLDNKLLLDEIVEVLTKSKAVQERKDEIHKISSKLKNATVDSLANSRGISGYHSLSRKAILAISKELWETNMNQMQILHSSNLIKASKTNLKGQKNIFADDEAILSPVAKRAQRECMKVINRLREIHGEFDSIVIEVTRDKNTDDQKKRIKDTQKYYESKNKEVKDMIGEDTHVNAKTKEKIRLYNEQEGKCIYSGERLELDLILRDPTAYEVDHILPISASLDDSINNKVLVTHSANQEKGNLTPFMAFVRGKFSKNNLETYKSFVISLKNKKLISGKKLEYLLYEKDLTKFTNMKEFINRNLVDTSYACRVVLNTLTDYFNQNNIDTKVHTVRGKATGQFRRKIGLKKDRDEDYSHHAIDALIVASLKKQAIISDILAKYSLGDLYDDVTGEIMELNDEFYDTKYMAFLSELKNLKVIKFSHKVDTKPNRAIADETIYSTRIIDGQDKVIKKYKDIYDSSFTALANDIINKQYENKYLMAMHDPQTFSVIKDYIEHWYNEFKNDETKINLKDKGVKKPFKKNPLSDYKETFGNIKKYSKKGNGPNITQLKYVDGILGNHLAITQKYETESKKVILLQISPYRTDFYKLNDGTYKFVTIRYKDVHYSQKIKKYTIDRDWYNNQKEIKKISDDAPFVCSLHHDELIGITKKAGEKKIYIDTNLEGTDIHDGSTPEILKFTATNNDKENKVEVKPIYKYDSKQLKPTISKSVIKISKYSTDVLGNLYEIKNSILKLEF